MDQSIIKCILHLRNSKRAAVCGTYRRCLEMRTGVQYTPRDNLVVYNKATLQIWDRIEWRPSSGTYWLAILPCMHQYRFLRSLNSLNSYLAFQVVIKIYLSYDIAHICVYFCSSLLYSLYIFRIMAHGPPFVLLPGTSHMLFLCERNWKMEKIVYSEQKSENNYQNHCDTQSLANALMILHYASQISLHSWRTHYQRCWQWSSLWICFLLKTAVTHKW
jgi:hypothetical protein